MKKFLYSAAFVAVLAVFGGSSPFGPTSASAAALQACPSNGGLNPGETVRCADRSCKSGIREIVGGSRKAGIRRQSRCV